MGFFVVGFLFGLGIGRMEAPLPLLFHGLT